MLINKGRNVIAYVENEPDGDEAGDAIKINLQEIANDVSIKQPHYSLDSPVLISVVKSMAHAKSPAKLQIRIPKPETRQE